MNSHSQVMWKLENNSRKRFIYSENNLWIFKFWIIWQDKTAIKLSYQIYIQKYTYIDFKRSRDRWIKKSLKSIFKFFQISKIGRIEFLNFHVLINHFWRLLNSRFFKYSRLKQIDQFNSNRIENMTRGDTTMLLPPQTCPI